MCITVKGQAALMVHKQAYILHTLFNLLDYDRPEQQRAVLAVQSEMAPNCYLQ